MLNNIVLWKGERILCKIISIEQG